jgi:hypothetical protein
MTIMSRLIFIVLTLLATAPAFGQGSWEFDPYRVELWTAVAPEVPWTAADQRVFDRDMVERSESSLGAAWRLNTVDPPENLRTALATNVTLVDVPSIEALVPDVLKNDKLMLLSVKATSRDYYIEARELDCRTRTFGPVIGRHFRQRSQLATVAFSSLMDAFAAIVRIEAGEGRTLTVRVRAGGLVLNRASPAYVAEGDVLQPIVRRNDRLGKPQSVEVVDWTFLQVDSRDTTNPNLLEVAVHSGWRSPIRGRAGSRREQYGLAIRPTQSTSQLFVEAKVGRNESPYPLPGMEIYAREPSTEPPPQTIAERQESEKRNPPEFLGYTDWRGSVEVGPHENRLRLVYIKNGGQLLARLPMVPGLKPRRVAQVPDDDPRLQAEGFIKGFNGELMDLVAQRQILAARIRKRVSDGKPAEAEQLLEQFRMLASRNDMQRRLDQQQNRQQVPPNRTVAARIDKLYADTRTALANYLDPELDTKLLKELEVARQGG